MSYHFIVNPVATRCPKDIEARLRARFPQAPIHFTDCAGDAARLARQALEEGVGRTDRLIACGGDGTFREVAGVAGGYTTLGLLPVGTVNLVARQLGVPPKLAQALDCLDEMDSTLIYPGRCVLCDSADRPGASPMGRPGNNTEPGELFFIGVSAGLDADAVHRMNPALKRRAGRLAYVVGLLGRLRWPVLPEVQVRSAEGSRHCGQAVVLKMPAYGGPYRLGRSASLACPWLEIVTVERGRWAVLRVFWRAMRDGSAAGDGAERWPTSHLELSLPSPGRLQIDGDPFTARRVEVYPNPAPIRVLCNPRL